MTYISLIGLRSSSAPTLIWPPESLSTSIGRRSAMIQSCGSERQYYQKRPELARARDWDEGWRALRQESTATRPSLTRPSFLREQPRIAPFGTEVGASCYGGGRDGDADHPGSAHRFRREPMHTTLVAVSPRRQARRKLNEPSRCVTSASTIALGAAPRRSERSLSWRRPRPNKGLRPARS